ncbi:DUF4184 family protein [Hymenobacter tenuis]
MPFTFSHPAAVLPLMALPKHWRSATGLIIGSMAPDFEKFLRMSAHDPYSHTWRSIFYFNLPLGILLALAFHLLLRDALILHLPQFLRERFAGFMGLDWLGYLRKNYFTFLVSLLIGIVSHLAWDSFTHVEGRGVQLFPLLKAHVLEGPFRTRLYSLLQKLTSVVGAAAMVVYIWRLPTTKLAPPKTSLRLFWGLVLLLSLVVIGVRSVVGRGIELHNIYLLSIVLISAGLTSLLLAPMLLPALTRLLTRPK